MASFVRLVEANQPSMTVYNFLISAEGRMATVAITTLTYTLFALLGHLWGDRYRLSVGVL